MTEEEAFLQAIIDNPDDDAPRLIYANWLEELGNRDRAEFIRLQCLADQKGPGHRELEIRAKELEALYWKEWLWPVADIAEDRDKLEAWCFRRGFLDVVFISATTFLENAEALFQAAPLLRSVLFRYVPECIGELAASPYLGRLTVITMETEEIDDSMMGILAASPHLARLTNLELCNNSIGDAGAQAIANSPYFSALRQLDLSDNQIGDAGAEAMASSTLLGSLTQLSLYRNRVGDAGARALAATPYLTQLEYLELAGNPLGEAGILALRERFAPEVIRSLLT